eukprot:TRINITY_DN5770_c0_g1_i4.p1 TRINITY_DN5770_c0_g1~~TRINITY_DN5770_c0_g1_i4.p1  ORF type:complete len:514 (-),score=81.10 TRINITY_DN5770_c0_g1_i4:99-1547(-)
MAGGIMFLGLWARLVRATDVPKIFGSERSFDVKPGKGSIGVGIDAARSNFWTFAGNYPLEFYSDDMDPSCFTEEPCSHSEDKGASDFTSTKSWEENVVQRFGIDIHGGYKGFTGSLSASMGLDFDNSWSEDKDITWAHLSKTRKCYELRSSCLTNPAFLSDRVKSLLDKLASRTGTDSHTMDLWTAAFVRQFGSHVVVKSSHGGLIQSTSSMDKSCKSSSSLRTAAACGNFSFMEYISAGLCAHSSDDKNSSGCQSTLKTVCTAVGGDDHTSSRVCSNDTTADEINSFLESGDVNSSSSIISLELRPMDEVLIQMGYFDAALQVGKAIEYYSCKYPLGAWVSDGNGGNFCKCALECKNGGTLDTHSCSCSCPGDDDHGFTGMDCSKTYGKCVRGVGASGTPTAKMRACVDGNTCGGIEHSEKCGNSDVCCNRDEAGLCCPFGSICNCFAIGWRHCQCVPGQSGTSLYNATNGSAPLTEEVVI